MTEQEKILIKKFGFLSLLLETYTSEFSLEDAEQIDVEELKYITEALSKKIELIAEREKEAGSDMNALQEDLDKSVAKEVEDLIVKLASEIKAEI